MTHEDQNNLSSEEQRRFAALPREKTPPHSLEKSIMNELSQRGLLGQRTSLQRGIVQLVAAAVLLILGGAGGYFLGTQQESAVGPTTTNSTYILLLHESPTPPENEAELVKEYSQWAAELYEKGQFVGGEKLSYSGKVLTRTDGATTVADGMFSEGKEILSGYFIIQAKNYDEALAIASQCPHLKYGGTVELREIDRT